MNDNDSRDIAYLIVAAAGLLAINRLWTLKVRPWLGQYIQVLHDDAGAPALHILGITVSSIDLIATASTAVMLYVLYRLGRSRLRAIARERRAAADGVRQPVEASERV